MLDLRGFANAYFALRVLRRHAPAAADGVAREADTWLHRAGDQSLQENMCHALGNCGSETDSWRLRCLLGLRLMAGGSAERRDWLWHRDIAARCEYTRMQQALGYGQRSLDIAAATAGLKQIRDCSGAVAASAEIQLRRNMGSAPTGVGDQDNLSGIAPTVGAL